MTPKVALVCPAKIVTLAGTVAADVALFRLTSRLLAGAEGTVTVPVEALAPAFSATEVGFSTKVKGGAVTDPLTVKLLLAVPLTLAIVVLKFVAVATLAIRT